MKNVTFRQLRVFDAVARHLSFSRAAEELHLTQPAVSMQVKALESEAGMPLVEQVGKRIFLTAAGAELSRCSRAIGEELRATGEALNALRGLTQGRLHIALVSTAKYFAPALLSRFLKSHPGVTLKLEVENRETVMAELEANRVDLAITGRPPEHIDVVAEPIAVNPHVAFAAPGHPLARKRRIPLARLAGETFVMREPGSGTRGLLERLFAERGLALDVSMELASNESVKQAVIAEMGIGFLSRHTLNLELAGGHLVLLDVEGTPIERNWYVVHLAAKRLSPIAHAVQAYLRRETAPFLTEWGARPPSARSTTKRRDRR